MTPPPTFAPPTSIVWKKLRVGVALGVLTWGVLLGFTKGYLYWVSNNLPSPFADALSGTAYDLRLVATSEPNENQNEVLFLVSLAQMGVRNREGRPIVGNELKKFADKTRLDLGPDANKIFKLSGTRTVVRLILRSSISKASENHNDDAEEREANHLAANLCEDEAIVRSREFLADLVAKKGVSWMNLAAATGVDTSEEGAKAALAVQDWPLTYDLALRCLQRGQNYESLRMARFWATFVGEWDVCLMLALFWFVIMMTNLRYKRARQERATVMDNQQVLEKLVESEELLKKNDFEAVYRNLDEVKIKTTGALFFQKMLGIVETELRTRQNRSKADSLLVWTQNAREEIASSRWLLNWCGRALPTIGFIFKVYGIAFAMKDSDTIALANGAFEQAAAISRVSGSLGLAFSATFIAFAASLVIGFIDARESHYERSVIAALEESLVPLLRVPPPPSSPS